jgi:predicted RNase H-like HicB family nuclease
VKFTIDLEQEEDGRWIAEMLELPGVLVYGQTPSEAKMKVEALASRALGEGMEHGASKKRRSTCDS